MEGHWLVSCPLASPLCVWVSLINPMKKDAGFISLKRQVWDQRMVDVKWF